MKTGIAIVIGAALISLAIFGSILALPKLRINWGRVSISSDSSVTVSGEAHGQLKSQIANFTAGVSATNKDKQTAVNEVNTKMATLTQAVKAFGIPEADIKTQSASVYQIQDGYYQDGTYHPRKGDWQASNDINITLRDLNRASELTDLLNTSGATNVYGPNFSVDDTNQIEMDLSQKAMLNARQKAEALAQASGKTVGDVITISETGSVSPIRPMYDMAASVGKGGGPVPAPIEPGSTEISKSLTVTFELK
jgi:uncharacterized protein